MTTLRLINLAATQDNTSTKELGDALTGSASAGLIVQSYCNQVLQQPDIILPASVIDKLPPVNTYLKDARSHADSYLRTVQPKIIQVVTDVGGYSDQFTSFYMLINDRLQDWKGGDQSAKDDAVALLQQLQNAIDEKKQNVIFVTNDIGSFLSNVNADTSNFNTASSRADVVILGSEGVLASLDQQIGELDKQIAGAATGVALSGLAILGGVFVVCVGAVASFVTAGTSIPVVIGGVALIVAGAAGLTASSIVLANAINTKGNLLQQKAELNASLKFLHDFKSTMGQLSSSASMAATQLTNMQNAWTILGNNMGNVVKALDNARTYDQLPITVQAYLNTANKQWTTVQKNVQTIEQQMTGVQTTVLKNSSGQLMPLNSTSINNVAKAA